jgi:hypothetical protein
MEMATFYMTSSEFESLRPVRRCQPIRRVRWGARDDWMLVEINPPLAGQSLGLGGEEVTQVALTTRHQGTSLFPIDRWPVYVHVALSPTGHTDQSGAIEREPVEAFGWAEIYPTEAGARAASPAGP